MLLGLDYDIETREDTFSDFIIKYSFVKIIFLNLKFITERIYEDYLDFYECVSNP